MPPLRGIKTKPEYFLVTFPPFVALILLWTTSDVRKEKAMNGVREITEASFQSEVLASNQPVLVDFFAPWCGPCKMLAPALEGIAKNYSGRIKVVKVNVDAASGTNREKGSGIKTANSVFSAFIFNLPSAIAVRGDPPRV